jgi:hypothetical protein
MKFKCLVFLVLILPVSLFAQQAKTALENLNKILSYNDSLVNLSISFPKHQAKSFSLKFLKQLVVYNQEKMPSNVKNQVHYADGDLVSAEGPGDREEFEIFMAQKFILGPFNLNIGNEKFQVEASLEDGFISSIDYINPKNKNILRFIYHGETHQVLQFEFQTEGYNEKSKNENIVLYFNSFKESGGIDRNANLLNKEEVANLARQFYLITEQLIFRYKAKETDYAYAIWKKENMVLKVDSFLQTFNQSKAKDTYGNDFNTYFYGAYPIKIYTRVIVSPAQEKTVMFDYYNFPPYGKQYSLNKITDGLRKIISEELNYKIGSYASFPSGAEKRALFVISNGKIVELRD